MKPWSDRLAAVRAEIAACAERDRLFAGLHPSNPRWSMVLTLEAAALSDTPSLPLCQLIDAAGLARTTGIRVARALEAGGWVQVVVDPLDQRRRHVSLSAHAVAVLDRYRARFGYVLPVGLEDAIAASAAPGSGRRPEATTRPVLDAPAVAPADVSAPESRPSRRPAERPRGARGLTPETVSP